MRAAKVDANQGEIVETLRGCGWSVQSLARVGFGCPDLLVGASGCNVLFEVKDGAKVQSARTLTQMQEDWHRAWRGQVAVVETTDQAVAAVLAEIARRWPEVQR